MRFIQKDFFHEGSFKILEPDLMGVAKKDMWEVSVYPSSIRRVMTLLRDHGHFLFCQLSDLTAIDFLKERGVFQIIYHLLSHALNRRIRVRLSVIEGGSVPSCCEVFSCANWYEREVYDMFGISFVDHPGLSRILTDYGFQGHPLRKDFPLWGRTELSLEGDGDLSYVPLYLEQEYRDFDFSTPWRGGGALHEGRLPMCDLPGDEKSSFLKKT